MKVKCNKIISPTTKRDLGEHSPWLVKGKEYVVLALSLSLGSGLYMFIQSEHYNEPIFVRFEGFEFTSDKIPSNWITVIKQNDHNTSCEMLPESWAYENFFEELADEKSEAVKLFIKEAEKINQEEGYTFHL